jgi:hypothetical protein
MTDEKTDDPATAIEMSRRRSCSPTGPIGYGGSIEQAMDAMYTDAVERLARLLWLNPVKILSMQAYREMARYLLSHIPELEEIISAAHETK